MNDGSILKKSALMGALGAIASFIAAILCSYLIDVTPASVLSATIAGFIVAFLGHTLSSRTSK